jgi:hypothetical protein
VRAWRIADSGRMIVFSGLHQSVARPLNRSRRAHRTRSGSCSSTAIGSVQFLPRSFRGRWNARHYGKEPAEPFWSNFRKLLRRNG